MSAGATPNQKLLDRLEASRDKDGSLAPLILELQSEQGQRDFAQAHGIYLPWVPALHLMERHAPGTFVRLAGLADPAVDQRSLFHRWIASVWTAKSLGLQSHVVDVELQRRCGAAMMLHADAAAGHVIDRSGWRQARSALSDTMDSSLQGCAVGVVAAGCWDPDAIPNVFADIFHAWSRVLHEEVRTQKGWEARANQEAQQNEQSARHAAGLRAAGPMPENQAPDWRDSDEGKTWVRRYKEAVIAFTTNPPDGMFQSQKAIADAHRRLAIGLADNALSLMTGVGA